LSDLFEIIKDQLINFKTDFSPLRPTNPEVIAALEIELQDKLQVHLAEHELGPVSVFETKDLKEMLQFILGHHQRECKQTRNLFRCLMFAATEKMISEFRNPQNANQPEWLLFNCLSSYIIALTSADLVANFSRIESYNANELSIYWRQTLNTNKYRLGEYFEKMI